MGTTLNCLPLAECLDPPVFVLTAMLKIIELWPNPWAAGARRENMHGVFPPGAWAYLLHLLVIFV